MLVKEAYVTREKIVETFSIIEQTLLENHHTQVFIENDLIKALDQKPTDYIRMLVGGVQFYYWKSDEVVQNEDNWKYMCDSGFSFDERFSKAGFIINNNDFWQLSVFKTPKIGEYINYISGFDQMLLVYLKPE